MKYIFISLKKKFQFLILILCTYLTCVCVCVCIRRNKIQFRLYYQYKVHTLFSCPLAIVNWNDFSQSSSSSSSLIFQCEKSFNFLLSDHFNHFFSVFGVFFVFSFSVSFLIKTFSSVYLFVQFQVNIYYRKRKKIIVSFESIHQRR